MNRSEFSDQLPTNAIQCSFDAFLPEEMARRAKNLGVQKAHLPLSKMFLLAVLAGAFIAMGAIFSTTVTAGATSLPFGLARLLAGVAFSLGLILVVVAGAELFTGNNLIVMAMASRKISFWLMMRNWMVVYVGNFIGAFATALLMLFSRQFEQGNGIVGENAMIIANVKCGLDFIPAFFLGVLCNSLVCLSIWLCYSARSTTDKILSIVFPITAFVASGFEHSIANMYFIPMGLLIKTSAIESSGYSSSIAPDSLVDLTWTNFFYANLIPVTLGNIVGGALMVGLVYWLIHLRKNDVISVKRSN